VTANFRSVVAPFERAPSTPSTGRFLRVAEPRTARSLSVRAAVYVPRFDGVVKPDDLVTHFYCQLLNLEPQILFLERLLKITYRYVLKM
jgi:hypothetical protein